MTAKIIQFPTKETEPAQEKKVVNLCLAAAKAQQLAERNKYTKAVVITWDPIEENREDIGGVIHYVGDTTPDDIIDFLDGIEERLT